jgi:LysM repeat protein
VKGDSFYKIAKANGVSVRALTDANPGVDSAKLKIGQVLQIPAGVQPAAASSASSTAPAGVEPPAHAKASAHATVSSSSGRYVVKVGDTLAKIARAHRTTVKAIKTANGLTSDRLVVGHSLKMPAAKAAAAAGA